MKATVLLPARPEPIELDATRTALVVVDMQNAYVSKGGYLDLLGMDISGARDVANLIGLILPLSRASGMLVAYLQLGWDKELREAGGADLPNYHKHNAIRLMRQRPALAGRLLTKGTWDYAIVEMLEPEPTDFIVSRPRHSGFSGTSFDNLLRSRGIRNLVFTGIATNICVELTIRDAYFLEYFPILISDCAWQAGPRFVHDASLFNVETFFGWVTTSGEYIGALKKSIKASAPEVAAKLEVFPK